MNDEFAKRVRAAAIAGWWTVLIVAAFTTFQWLAYLCVLKNRPACVRAMWGPDVTWATVESVWLWAIAALKFFIWLMVTVLIWLSLWARKLRRL